MKIDILKLRQGPITADVDLSPAYLAEGSEEEGIRFDPGTGEITFRLVGNDILAEGKLHSRMHASCARCLGEASIPLDADVHLYYWPKREDTGSKIMDIDPEEPDFGEYEGDTIDPDEDLRELLLVEVPLVVLCSDDCKGLCPRCGENRNLVACNCRNEEEEEQAREHPAKPSWKDQLQSLKIPDKK